MERSSGGSTCHAECVTLELGSMTPVQVPAMM
jgi:hypothetical protein